MRRVIFSILFLIGSLLGQSNETQIVALPNSTLTGHPTPRWNGGLMLRRLDQPTGNFGLWFHNSKGEQIILELSLPEKPIVEIFDACATKNGFAAVGALTDTQTGKRASSVLLFDARGALQSVIRTNPYLVKHVVAGPDGDFWTFGQNEVPAAGGTIPDHPMLYHFRTTGELVGKLGSLKELELPVAPIPFASFSGVSSMTLTKNGIAVYLHQYLNRLIEFDFMGNVTLNKTVPPPPDVVGNQQAPMRIRAFTSTGSSGKLLAGFSGNATGIRYYTLDELAGIWNEAPGMSPKEFGRIIGREDDQFVTVKPLNDGAAWVFSFKPIPSGL